MRRSEIWATEEVVLPTLVALLGYEVAANPCSYDYVRYRVPYTLSHVEDALSRREVFWLHPVPRRYEDKMRKYIRDNSEALRTEPRPARAAGVGTGGRTRHGRRRRGRLATAA